MMEVMGMEVFKKFILVMSLAVSLFATKVAAMEGNPLAAYEHKGSTVGEYTFDGRRWRSPRKFVSRDLVYRAMQASTSSAVASAAVEVDASSRTGAGDISWPAVGSFAFGSSGFGSAVAQAVLPGKTKISRKDIDTFASESLAKFRQVEGCSASAGKFIDFLTEIKTELERELGAEYLGNPLKSRTNAVTLYQAVNGLLQSIDDIIALQPAPASVFASPADHVAINIDVANADDETDVRAQSTERETWRAWAYKHRWKIIAGVVVSVAVVGTVVYIVTTGDVGAAIEALQARFMDFARGTLDQMHALGGNIADFTRRVMGGIRPEDYGFAQARIAELEGQLAASQETVRSLTAQTAELPGLRGAVGELTGKVADLSRQLFEAQGVLRMAQEQAARLAAVDAGFEPRTFGFGEFIVHTARGLQSWVTGNR